MASLPGLDVLTDIFDLNLVRSKVAAFVEGENEMGNLGYPEPRELIGKIVLLQLGEDASGLEVEDVALIDGASRGLNFEGGGWVGWCFCVVRWDGDVREAVYHVFEGGGFLVCAGKIRRGAARQRGGGADVSVCPEAHDEI